ncbi:MAG: hypothetical protein WAT22_17695 [Saprospiraceae bacterium]|nr:hypothetical protein [Saprospiraceae bacterium]
MKKILWTKIVYFTFFHMLCIGQTTWNFTHDIHKNSFYKLSGMISGKFPIKMYLEQDTFLCGNPYDDDKSQTLKGWYFYEKTKTKIPFKGAYNTTEGREYIELFVPANKNENINIKTCKLKEYTEMFVNQKEFDLTKMQWKMKKSSTFSPVDLIMEHRSSPETKITISFSNGGKKQNIIDISQLSGAKYLTEFRFFDTKNKGKFYYATFEFQEWSRQDDNANAMCGAGIERYLGYVKLDSSGKVVDYKICLRESCWHQDKVEELMIVPGFPEYGLVESD